MCDCARAFCVSKLGVCVLCRFVSEATPANNQSPRLANSDHPSPLTSDDYSSPRFYVCLCVLCSARFPVKCLCVRCLVSQCVCVVSCVTMRLCRCSCVLCLGFLSLCVRHVCFVSLRLCARVSVSLCVSVSCPVCI